jgi:hypothetical protein
MSNEQLYAELLGAAPEPEARRLANAEELWRRVFEQDKPH